MSVGRSVGRSVCHNFLFQAFGALVSKTDILYDCMIEHAVKRLRNEANEKADCTRPRHVYERDKTRRRNKIAKSKNQVFRPPDFRGFLTYLLDFLVSLHLTFF